MFGQTLEGSGVAKGRGPRDNGKDQWQGQAAPDSASLAATAVASSKF